MGFLDRLRWSASVLTEPEAAPSFAVDATAIDPAVFGLTSYASPTSPSPRVDRATAIQVGAVKRSRDLVAGSLGSLPVDLFGPGRVRVSSQLLDQPERGVPRSVTMTRTIEDMLFEGVAWWRITETGWQGFPAWVKRVPVRRVTVNEDTGTVYIDGKAVPDEELIRFDSPNDPLLVAGARAIRTCLALDSATYRYADEPLPSSYFTPADEAAEPEEADVQAALDAYITARKARATAYIPAALKLNTPGLTPDQLQLSDSREDAVKEIARHAGVDPEELGVSTTSRTYNNAFDRRKSFTDFTLGAYMTSIQDRLSMPDVTPRGYYARFNLDAFLRSDTLSRYQAYEVGLRVGAIDPNGEVRALEDKPPLATPPPAPAPQESNVRSIAAQAAASARFDTEPAMVLDAPGSVAFEVDTERRTIKGLAVPYGVPARSGGQLWQFSKGTLRYSDVSRVKLWVQHDQNRAIGVATKLEDTDAGLVATFKVARGAAGDEALAYAEDGVLDGLSVGLGVGGRFRRAEGVNHAVEAPLMEVSLTPAPAFDDARVHAVAASAAHQEGTPTMTEQVTQVAEAAEQAPDFSAITDAINSGFANLAVPQRETVPAGHALEVREELPYRFDGTRGAHSFVDDLRSYSSGNPDAIQRLEAFMGEAFAVTTTNVGSLNPTQNRPELYVPNLSYTRPLWELVSTGTITDKTPFTVPKFSAAAGLVGAHTEGTEPTPGSFSATSQTVTPGAKSGKIEINREVWDQGGSPQADGIIWGEMLNGWFESIEAAIATMLNGLSLTETNLAGAVDEALVDAVTGVVIATQYARGGNRFTSFAADQNLFTALVNASDTGGRKLLPVLGASNAQGTVTGSFDRIGLGNLAVRAAWALNTGVMNAANSYLFVPSSVWAWASAPKRFTFEYQVKSVDMAIWGYVATATLRDTDVKRIDYTTADV